MPSDRSLFAISLFLFAASAALVFVGLGQCRSYGHARRLCDELRQSTASLQSSVARLEAVASGQAPSAPGHWREPGAVQARAEAGARYEQPTEELQSGEAMQAYMNALAKRNLEQHAQDTARFGEKLESLYRLALDEEGSGSRDANRAFGELVEKYPDAHATGRAIANRGLLAAMKQRTVDVEMFRNMLSRQAHFKAIVTDSHIDAYPALCGYLANRYVMEGRPEDAEALLNELVGEFSQCYVAVGGFGSKPMLVPVDRFAERVRREAKESPPPPAEPRRGPGGG